LLQLFSLQLPPIKAPNNKKITINTHYRLYVLPPSFSQQGLPLLKT